jgi:periplasmic divalent cation tolerance protein
MATRKQQHHLGVIIISTFPNEASAVRIAKELVIDKRLCACVNLVKVRSLYSWNNAFEDHEEYIALFKTTKSSGDKLKSVIKKEHPYEVPEIVEITMDDVSESYLKWMMEATVSNRQEYE